MEDEERQKKLEAGKAKLAEYRMRKAHADSQKKQKKKKKKKPSDDSEGDSQGRVEGEPDRPGGGGGEEEEVVSGGGGREGSQDPPTTEFTFTRTLRSGETVKHDQTYNIEPESEVSTTAEDYSSEEEVEHLQQGTKGGAMQDMEDALSAKTRAVEELSRELEEIRAAFGTEGIQQLQDFEAALKQRDGIITQLTSNLQQAREEKDEIMKEFLALTEQSQKLQIQFQQLQAGETLRNTSHSSTAADLLQARQQIVQYQQQLEEMNVEVKQHRERSSEQLEHISQLQHKLNEVEMSERKSAEAHTQRLNEKDLLIAEQEKVILSREQSLAELRTAEETFAQTLKEKNQLILEQTAIITEHERSLTLLREELTHVGRTTDENIMQPTDEKDLVIAQQERSISERDASLTQLQDELKTSEKCLRDLQQRMTANESELEKCRGELESSKSDLESREAEIKSCKLQLENERKELESCQGELVASRQKERMSSSEIMQLMGTVEDLQKRCHQGSLSESDAVQKMQDDTARKLELLRAELDEMYGQQIVQMKQELNLQHAARAQQVTEQHHAELELIKAQQLSLSSAVSSAEVENLNAKIRTLQQTLEESQATHNEARRELGQVGQEKLNLQARVEDLLREKAEQVSLSLKSQESKKDELQQLQETIDGLRSELSAAREAATEAETKHDSEVTNYKIKLEMLEREKDAVLDRMAESQEAELERLRTQLLFSHEEELTNLREELQRESFLNTENLLNEAATKHEKALHELRVGYEGELHLLQREKSNFATERDELLHQIVELKEDLNLALHSSKAEKLVQQIQELQIELEELRKVGEERARLEKENQALQKQAKEKEQHWAKKLKEHEQEKETLVTSNNSFKEELDSKIANMETLAAEKSQIQRQVAELREELEKQRTTFSFAEKNFDVNYQELKAEYTCLVEAKAKLEEKMLRETLEFEAKICSFQSQIRELEESSRDVPMEKESSELMEKLSVTLSEKTSLAGRLSEVTERLRCAEGRVGELEEELTNARREHVKAPVQTEGRGQKLDEKQEIMSRQTGGQSAQREAKPRRGERDVEPSEDHHLQIQSLQEEIKTLRSLLRGAEAERDGIRRAVDLQRLSQTPSPAAAAGGAQSSGEGPVEGRASPHKSTASGSGRRKRRQRSKQERRAGTALSDGREERRREEEDEEAAVLEESAKSAAEEEMQPQMESQVKSRERARAGKEDSAAGCQGDGGSSSSSGGHINKGVSRRGTDGRAERFVSRRTERERASAEHGDCRLQMEAQRLSQSQIHAAQLELLQEETDAQAQLRLQDLKDHQGEQKVFNFQNMIQAVSEECSQIVLTFRKVFGEDFFESVGLESRSLVPEETPTTRESTSAVLEARELYRDLQHMRDQLEQEHQRLSQLQTLLRADGSKVVELQTAYDELKRRSEQQISDMHLSASTSASHRDRDEPTGASASSATELRRLKEEAQEKQQQLEESHRQEMERLRAHYQQEATESEERYATELFMLQQRLQEVTAGAQSHDSLSGTAESGSETMDEHIEELKELREAELSEGGAEQRRWSVRSAGLTAQLQALRKALYNKYLQEVAALKEQHSSELRSLREEREQGRDGGEPREGRAQKKQDIRGGGGGGGFTGSLAVASHVLVEDKKLQAQVEEEVAKAIVQMSVEFAQQTELARINKRACQASTSMQTHLDQGEAEEAEEAEAEELTPRASVSSSGAWLEEVERERLERELEERNVEIRKLKEELQRSESGPEQVLRRSEDGDEEVREGRSQASSQDDGESPEKDTERNLLFKANKKLSEVLVEVLKTTAAAEETMGLHMQSLRDASDETQPPGGKAEAVRPPAADTFQSSHARAGGWSAQVEADGGLEASRQAAMDSLLLGAGPQLENEEHLMGISGRLQTALERMLMAISDSTNQLEHARITQTELMRESFRRNQEMNELLQKQEELQERLAEEARAREQLALELHRAEGLIDGYTGERTALEEQLRQKEELQLSLEQELQVTSSRLHELEQERLQMQEERELLSRQQDAMREDAGPRELRLVEAALVAAPEADLLEETEKLMKEKVEVQRQAEKENTDLLKQVKLLEAELEEQVNRVIELEHAQTTESGDLRQQVQALEKQLEKNRRFLDEQAVDREHERDFFQQEIQKLEQQLKNPQKLQAGSEERNRQVDGVTFKVDQLTSQLKEKADWCSELLLSSEQLRRELGERDEEIDKLESRIRELEQALLASADSLEKVEQKKQHASITEAKHSTLEAQLQTEREALERKEKEICNLEEQLEQFREELENKSEEVQQLHMQLEIQRKEISSQQQYLETRDAMFQVMEEKDRQIALLNEQITKLQHTETTSDNKELDEQDELIKDLESQVECLKAEQERLKRNNEEELDQLNAVIDKLQQELANIEQKQAMEEDEEAKGALEGAVCKEEHDELKQRMDLAAKELDTLKTERGELLETCRRLKESAEAGKPEGELEEALREKTAGLVVMQAQVQALEQSAASRVEQLDVRIQELESLADEKDSEISRCRLLVEQSQSYADGLQQRVSKLEENLRDRVAAALVSQATLEAFQQQQQQPAGSKQDLQKPADTHDHEFGDFGIPRLEVSGLAQAAAQQAPTGKVVHLTQKLRQLEVGLSGMQEDQELQKQLLSSSEEEVLEYERRLAVLMDLLSQMKARTQQRAPSVESSSDEPAAASQLLQELQEVRDEASAAKEQLDGYKLSCRRLEEELQEKTAAVERLEEQLQKVSSHESEEMKVSELKRELMETQNDAAASKEELSSCKESLEKLQELLQEREMTIAQLKAELFQVKADEDAADTTELLQQLEKVQNDAASTKEELSSSREQNEKLQEDLRLSQVSLSEVKRELEEMRTNVETTKEELSSFRQRNEKLQEELRARELAISKLKEELQELRTAVMKTAESGPPSPSPSPSPQPPSSASSSTTQPKRKGGKQPAGKGSSAKDKTSVSRKNSSTSSQSSSKPHSSRPNSSSEQQQHAAAAAVVTDSFTQTDPLQMSDLSRESEKEEVEEVIGEFQEKIVQMQELHAAEILDMEARHISESENLRRDTQALEDECKALKAVIDKLRSAEALSSRQERLPSQIKDGYTSDSSSDYSQRTGYDLPSLQQEFRTTPEGARRETDDQLPDRIKTLLREVHQEGMQVLSLSELPLSEGEPGGHLGIQGWLKERDALLATVESLKNLITQMQTRRETQTSGGADWRAQLLDAVRQVFLRERGVLKSALYSQLDLLDTNDAIVHLNQLEHRLAEQDVQHREAMGSLHTAERSSLIAELHQLRAQLEQLHQGVQPALSPAGECSMKEQREGGGAEGAAEADRLLVEELKAELLQTKLELETTLKAQHKHLKELDTLRSEVSQKAAELDALSDHLTEEKKKSRDLQWTVEKEKCRTGRTEESKREELEDLQLSLEEQKSRAAQLTVTLEQERQASSRLSQQSEQERLSLHRGLQELQVQLQTERAKAREVNAALGRERELRTGASSSDGGGGERGQGVASGPQEEQALLERLQKELDDKHAQVVDLLGQVEAQKLEVVRRDEELARAGQRSKREQEALLEARTQLETLQMQTLEVQEQLETELERRRSLEEEKEQLEERLHRFGERREAGGPVEADGQSAAWRGDSTDRTKDWVFQQKSPGETSTAAAPAHGGGLHHGPWRTVDRIVGKLHLISSKVCGMASKNTGRPTAEVNSEDLSWVQSNIEEVITMLQHSPGLPSIPESASLLAGGSSSSSNTLTERLLRQNAELTGFVSRLTEEKNDLRNHTLRLEEELRRYRQAGPASGDSLSRRGVSTTDSAGLLLSQEREAWTREKLRLEKALQLAQSQAARLRAEMRAENLREITGPDADNAALKRMYGKYLRSESFRKALIYQKKYLLLLLGGFQECEEATLSLLSRMGGRPSLSGLESFNQRRRGLMRFRSAVRVSIALSRMRFLVKRWHKATGMSSTSSCTVSKNGTGQISGTEARDSPYLHPGSVEMCRDRGGAGVSSRGRSGRESPRSAMSSTQHRYDFQEAANTQRFHMAGDHGPLTCSHLQSYDPDRALTDYISRLEALQRRLGSVTSGASSYAQLHFGLRR